VGEKKRKPGEHGPLRRLLLRRRRGKRGREDWSSRFHSPGKKKGKKKGARRKKRKSDRTSASSARWRQGEKKRGESDHPAESSVEEETSRHKGKKRGQHRLASRLSIREGRKKKKKGARRLSPSREEKKANLPKAMSRSAGALLRTKGRKKGAVDLEDPSGEGGKETF